MWVPITPSLIQAKKINDKKTLPAFLLFFAKVHFQTPPPSPPPSLSSTSNERTNNHATPFLWQWWWGSPPLLPSTTPRAEEEEEEEEAGAPLFNPSHPTTGRTPVPQLLYGVHSLQAPPFSLSLHAAGGGGNCGDSVRDGKGRRKEEEEHFFSPFFASRTAFIISSLPEFGLFFFAVSARVPKRTRADALTDPNNSGWHAPDFPSKRRQEDFSPPPLWPFPAKAERRACCCRASVEEDREGGEIVTIVSAGHSLAIVCV